MNCPKCNVSLTIADRQGVEIDFCPQCRGVWLDRGELDKILDRFATSTAQPTPPPAEVGGRREYDDDDRYRRRDGDDDDYYKYGKRKKRGFLSDIFDF